MSTRRPWPAEVRAEALRLRREGKSYRDVTAATGVPRSTVCQWEVDPDGSRLRARKDSYRGRCIDCDAPTDGSNGFTAAPTRCNTCALRHTHETRVWTQETVIEAIQAWAAHYGFPPTATDWNPSAKTTRDADRRRARFYDQSVGIWPVAGTVQREFGSWSAGIKAAGFDPFAVGHYGRIGEDLSNPVVREAIRLYGEGWSCSQIGERFGLSQHCVRRWLERCGIDRRPSSEARALRRQMRDAA